jgi:hypothetical protein
MVDCGERLFVDQRDRLGRGQPDDDAADQSGPGGGRDPVDIGKRATGFDHRLGDDEIECLDMGAGGDFRHHAAEGSMLADLREHDVGQDLAAPLVRPLDHRRRGLVAGRLDAEHHHRVHPNGNRLITTRA